MNLLRRHLLGRNARGIGAAVNDFSRRVILKTALGTQHMVDMLASDPLPRIC